MTPGPWSETTFPAVPSVYAVQLCFQSKTNLIAMYSIKKIPIQCVLHFVIAFKFLGHYKIIFQYTSLRLDRFGLIAVPAGIFLPLFKVYSFASVVEHINKTSKLDSKRVFLLSAPSFPLSSHYWTGNPPEGPCWEPTGMNNTGLDPPAQPQHRAASGCCCLRKQHRLVFHKCSLSC